MGRPALGRQPFGQGREWPNNSDIWKPEISVCVCVCVCGTWSYVCVCRLTRYWKTGTASWKMLAIKMKWNDTFPSGWGLCITHWAWGSGEERQVPRWWWPVCSVMSSSYDRMDWRLFCLWDHSGKNTGVDFHFLLQGIFPTQGSNPHLLRLLHWQADSLPTVPPEKPIQLCLE